MGRQRAVLHVLGGVVLRVYTPEAKGYEPPEANPFQNETEQGIPGLEELPVIEVVDHHRIFRGERCDRRKGQRR